MVKESKGREAHGQMQSTRLQGSASLPSLRALRLGRTAHQPSYPDQIVFSNPRFVKLRNVPISVPKIHFKGFKSTSDKIRKSRFGLAVRAGGKGEPLECSEDVIHVRTLISAFGFRFYGLGIRVLRSGFRVQGLRVRDKGLVFTV